MFTDSDIYDSETDIRTIITHCKNINGEIVQRTQKRKIIKMNKNVYRRLQLSKFGDNSSTTTREDRVVHLHLDGLRPHERKEEENETIEKSKFLYNFVNPKKKLIGKLVDIKPQVSQPTMKDNLFSIKLFNLTTNIKEIDLYNLVRKYQPARFKLPMDWNTKQARGYAFVSFYDKEHAKKAAQSLSGHGYGNLIISVETKF